jgi:hypothetical protein
LLKVLKYVAKNTVLNIIDYAISKNACPLTLQPNGTEKMIN